MVYEVQFEKQDMILFNFEEGKCHPVDFSNDEPNVINGRITLDDKKIGFIRLYELDNDNSFFGKCDNASGDCEVIANSICGKRGAVFKKYLPLNSEYESILILDQIEIDKEYRNLGIGSEIVKNLLYMINYQFGYGCTIFLCASDYESAKKYGFDSEEYISGRNRLISFYKKAGFRIIKDNVMVCTKIHKSK